MSALSFSDEATTTGPEGDLWFTEQRVEGVVAGVRTHVGSALAAHGLGDVCLACWGQALAGQQGINR
jgi:hypothetical protein